MTSPIFICGAARSGTSLLTDAINHSLKNFITDFKADYCGEGFFIDILQKINALVDEFYEHNKVELTENTLISKIPKLKLYQNLAFVVKSLCQEVYLNKRWTDKTPTASAIANLPFVAELWPDAKFVYIQRRGLENINSRLKKFPQLDFYAHCLDWRLCIANWIKVKDNLVPGNIIEIEHYNIVNKPEEVSNLLADFLLLDKEPITHAFKNIFPQLTNQEGYKNLSIHTVPWSEAQKDCFLEICAEIMWQNNYSLDESYFLS